MTVKCEANHSLGSPDGHFSFFSKVTFLKFIALGSARSARCTRFDKRCNLCISSIYWKIVQFFFCRRGKIHLSFVRHATLVTFYKLLLDIQVTRPARSWSYSSHFNTVIEQGGRLKLSTEFSPCSAFTCSESSLEAAGSPPSRLHRIIAPRATPSSCTT